VIGTFTADATSQQIFYANGEINGWVNGFQLRQVVSSVPEPGTALAGLVAVGLCAVRRRRG
jgi:MYXO-CTERM domain-containing protein